ncbi:fibronectin type III domain-containing protein [Flavobacteriaceae bacterium]|nr:fibronectin type III domain-containing protein [Flavobacteriaceae bacterium]
MKKITLLLMLLLTTTLSFSQVSIGGGDDGDGFNTPPISPYYGYSYSQSIYLASEIGTSGDITSIEYALNAGSDFTSADDNVDVWIGHTAITTFDSTTDWVDVSTLSHVLIDGTVTVNNNVLTITFNSSFAYNGTDNIVIAVDANEPGYGSSSAFVLSTNGPTVGLTLDQRSDSTNSDPASPAAGTLKQNRGNITFNGITQACPDTSALTLDAVTINTATISWTAGGTETAWEYVVQASGTGEPAASGTSTTSNPLTVSSLTGNTSYEIYLRADCGSGEFSAWVSTTFTTLCDLIIAPYSQDFENEGAIPDCMTMSGDEDWIFANSASSSHIGNAGVIGNSSASGGYFAYVDDSGAHGLGTTLETPFVDVSALTTPVLAFYLLSNNESYSNVSFSVDVYDGAAWNVGVFTSNTNTSDWEEKTIDLSSLTISGPIKARFIVDEDNGTEFYDDVAIDDVRIMEMPSCLTPSLLTLDAVTNNTATISWTAGGTETAWEYVVQASGTGEPAASGTSTTSNPLTVSSLTGNTSYEIYLRADCGGGDFSEWVSGAFTTLCDVVTSFPYSESFENITTGQPDCWEVDGSLSSTSSYHFSSYATGQSGRGMRFNSYNPPLGETSELITPVMDASALSSLELNFQYKNPTGGDLEILISNDGGQTYNSLASGLTGQADWAPKNYDLTSYISSTMLVKFKGTSNYGSGDAYIYLDEVGIREIPSCFEPTAITLDAVTTSTATISWTAGGTETAWEYVLDAYGSDEPSTGGTATTSNPLTVSVTADTAYDVYVRADCGAGDFSSWVKFSFITDCGISDEALSQDFDTATNFDSNCWEVVNGGDANAWTLITDSGNTFWNLLYNSAAHDDYLYSPKFSVIDGVTDAFNFKGWNPYDFYPEVIDVLVVDASDNSLIATLATDLNLPEPDATTGEATTFTYDLSAYEGQDVRIAFYSSTTDQNAARLDDFTLDAFSTLGTATNTLEGFTLYPTIVKEELNFRSQNNVEAITVFNLLGQKVFSGAPNTNNSSINLSKLRPGVYVVKVSVEGKTGSYKIVKE